MESDEESYRLEIKTDPKQVERQALWAGILPGMRVADLGCGPGKTSYYLNQLVGPDGETIGIDNSEQRITYANRNYHARNLQFILRDIRENLTDLGTFDFVWIRFVLEYYRSNYFDLIDNITKIVKPGGIICLIDLDYNCLTHFGLPRRLEKALHGIRKQVEIYADFDPYIGRKLYSLLYDLGYENIDVTMEAHHLIFGALNEVDAFNWTKKAEEGGKKSGYAFEEYQGGYDEFFQEFKEAFTNPRRFTYTPVIICKGNRPE
jgi:ubiquinone/menaquinone biosynthesis C-methylase UbiE